MDEQLLQFIRKELVDGYTKDQIRSALLQKGFPEHIVDAHLAEAAPPKRNHKHLIIGVVAVVLIVVLVVLAMSFFRGFFKTGSAEGYEQSTMTLEEAESILKEAAILSDQSLCNEIQVPDVRDRCNAKFEDHEQGPCDAACEEQKTISRAIILHNKEICNELENLDTRTECIEELQKRGIE